MRICSIMNALRRVADDPQSNVVDQVWPGEIDKIAFVTIDIGEGEFEIYGLDVQAEPPKPLWMWPVQTQGLPFVMAYLAQLVATGPTEGPIPPPGHPPGEAQDVPNEVIEAAAASMVY